MTLFRRFPGLFLSPGVGSQPWRSRPAGPADHPRTSFQTRVFGTRPLRFLFAEGVFTHAADAITLHFLPLYALALGATAAQIGLMVTMSGLAGAVALPLGVWLLDRGDRLRLIVLMGYGGGRLSLLLMIAAPFVVENSVAIGVLIALSGARWFASMMAHPAWTTAYARVVPLDIRRFYTSRRLLAMSTAVIVVVPGAGVIINAVGGLPGLQVVLAGAVILGGLGTLLFGFVAIEGRGARGSGDGSASYRALFQDRAYVRFLAGTLLLHGFVMLASPFFAVFLVRDLGANAAEVGALGAVEGIATVAGQAVAGALIVRFGSWRMLVASMVVVPVLPIMWSVMSAPWQAAIPNLIGGITWAAFNLATFSLVLEFAPGQNVSRYSAAHQAAVIVASFVGPLIGTMVVAMLGVRAVMVVSGLGRFLALAVIVAPQRDRRHVEVPMAEPVSLPDTAPAVLPDGGGGD